MKPTPVWSFTRRALSAALFIFAFCCVALIFTGTSLSQASRQAAAAERQRPAEAQKNTPLAPEHERLESFRQSVGGDITPVIVELRQEPAVLRKAAAEQQARPLSFEEIGGYAVELYHHQNQVLQTAAQHGVRLMMRVADVKQIDGSIRRVEFRYTYLLNGFAGYVATADLEKLRALPEVATVSTEQDPERYFLDKGVDYALGTHPSPTDRRNAVFGLTHELTPANPNDPVHPETPRMTPIDGYEGQGMIIAIIDSGVDWRHPMFGGTGHTTPLPRVSGQPESASDNKKVIYYYSLSSPGDPTDDFGHGTHVAATAAGYSVDGNTPPRLGFGLGRDGTGVGPTINNEQLLGVAPQARILAYKVCGPATACAGDIPLAIEDAASPYTLVSSGNTGPTPVPKPVADVINLSLGSTAGDPAAANSRAANNAALAGTIIAAAAGNSGPGLGTHGNPGVATLAIGVAAALDPGSVSVSDVLAPDQIPGETGQGSGPPPEKGEASNANTVQPNERVGMRIFPVAGGGPIPEGSLSAHYVFVDRRGNPPPAVPATVTNRIALVKGAGTFAQIANPIALQNPAAIIIITTVESATAVQVINGIPTFTMGPNDGNYLIDLINPGVDPGDGDDNVDVPNGTVSAWPIRLAERPTLEGFQPAIAGFSSRGPARHANANFRMLKPDIAAPGVGIVAAATIEGIPDEAVGMASLTGYTSANGTSMATPITAGALALIRQRIRAELDLDSTDLGDPQYRTRRFDTVTVARAMLQNAATNLRSGFGVPQPDGPSTASINEMGSGLINVADALSAQAVMVSPMALLTSPAEFSATPAPTPRTVLVPTASMGAHPVVRLNDSIVRTREVIIRDVTNGGGAGVYNLTWQHNRSTDHPGFQVSIVAGPDDTAPINSINVPPNGTASFYIRTVADGTQIQVDPTEFQWYVTATHTTSGKTLRMPFYYRAVTALFPNSAAPNLQPIENTEAQTQPCPSDTDGSYRVRYTYTGPAAIGFRVQEATQSTSIFFDPADEPLVPTASGTNVFNENSIWRDIGIPGTPQTPPVWVTQPNPDNGNSPAYFAPGAANQNHSLTMKDAITLPSTGVTLSFRTRVSLDNNFDFGFVEVSNDGGVNYFPVLSLTGTFSGMREVDLSGYAGQSIRIRFRIFTPAGASLAPGTGWHVEDIRISSDNFQTLADLPTGTTTFDISGKAPGTYIYRVAALYANPNPLDPGTTITGPFSLSRCVTVVQGPAPLSAVSRKAHGGAGTFDVPLPLTGPPGIECRIGPPGEHLVVFTFPTAVTAQGAAVSSGQGNVSGVTQTSPNEIAVSLSNVADVQTITVTLVQVSDGSTTGNVSAPMGVLAGDTTANRAVNSSDVSQTKVQVQTSEPVTADNFRTDVNVSGTHTSSDISAVKARSGNGLP
jgi:subtilisin family serine protease